MTSSTDIPRPIDCRQDRPFRNLNEVHRAGADGLNAIFRPGTLWEVGPFVHGVLPEVVRIVARAPNGDRARHLTPDPCGNAAFTQGVNYSTQPDASEASGKPRWFIESQLVWTPYDHREVGEVGGRPPATLAPLTPQVAAATGLACCNCVGYVEPCQHRVLSCNAGVIQSQRAEAENLRQIISEQQNAVQAANAVAESLRQTIRAQTDTLAKHEATIAQQNQRINSVRRALL